MASRGWSKEGGGRVQKFLGCHREVKERRPLSGWTEAQAGRAQSAAQSRGSRTPQRLPNVNCEGLRRGPAGQRHPRSLPRRGRRAGP
eukprot:3706294-Rhodomonas_salina.2